MQTRPAFHRGLRSASHLILVAMVMLGGIAAFAASHPPAIAAADPTVAAAGDYGCDPLSTGYNGLDGTLDGGQCQQKATSNLLVNGNFSAVLALGDQHYCGSLAEYQQAYDPTWGRVKSITHPIPGNHEYLTAGGSTPTIGCDSSNAGAAGYFNYFGSAAGTRGQGWYSFDIGTWHLIALNSNCSDVGGCIPSSPQGLWLAADLAAHPNQCILAYWHIPLFSSGGRASQNGYWLWKQLYAAHADLVLDGHDHIYERFDPQNADGVADPNGIREFIVGTGGANHTSIAAVAANSVVRNATTFGVLGLTLRGGSYSWQFEPVAGTFSDAGSASCHNTGSTSSPSPSTSPSPSPSPSTSPSPSRAPSAPPSHSPGTSPRVSPSAPPTISPSAPPSSSPPVGGSATFTPVADSYVDASAPATTHGALTSLRLDGSPAVRSYLRFNVGGLTGNVVSATLRVWANTSQTTGYDAYSVAENTWGETTITSANSPPFGTTKVGCSGKITAGNWTGVNVTSEITGNGTFSFGLSTTNSTAVALSSREGLYPPQLVIVSSGSGSRSQPTNPPTSSPTNPPTAAPSPTPTADPTAAPSPTASRTGSPGGTTLTPAADSYVGASTPTSNFGTLTQVRIDGSPVARAFLRFIVTGVNGAVNSAVMRIYANTAQTTGYDLYPVASTTWGETAIDDANAPPFGAAKLGSSGKIAAGTWTSVDVTSAISGNGTFSFGLSTTNATAVSLSSREGANPPQLVITWTSAASLGVPISPSRPDPRLVVLYLALPLLACGVLPLKRRRISRALSRSLVRRSVPAVFSGRPAADQCLGLV